MTQESPAAVQMEDPETACRATFSDSDFEESPHLP